MRADIARIPDVIGVTPVVSGPGFARRGEATKSVTITGIETETYFDVIALPEKIIAGRHDVGPLDIIIGIELAKDLGAAVGDKLSLDDRVRRRRRRSPSSASSTSATRA